MHALRPARIAPFTFKFALAFISLAFIASDRASAQTYSVTNANDSGVGSLRQAILQANADSGPSQIVMADGLGTIRLKSALPIISQAVSIDGGAGNAVSGSGQQRIFSVDAPGSAVSIKNLLLIDGVAKGGNGSDGGGGGAGLGGALYVNAGDVNVSGVRFAQNSAVGGSGSVGVGGGGGGLGGDGGLGASSGRPLLVNGSGGGGGGFAGNGGNAGATAPNPSSPPMNTSGGGGGGISGSGGAGLATASNLTPGGGGGGGSTANGSNGSSIPATSSTSNGSGPGLSLIHI